MIKLQIQHLRNIKILSSLSNRVLTDIHYVKSDLPKPLIIFAHGFKSFKNYGAFDLIADYFVEKGFIFIKFNFSHNGTTSDEPDKIIDPEKFGRNTIEIELDDLEAVIDFSLKIEKEEFCINKNEIFLLGHSRGGSDSIIKASENNFISKIVSWAAFNDFEKTWSRFYDMDEWEEKGVNYRENKLTGQDLPLYYSVYENYLQNKERFNIRAAIEKLNIPLLAIHGIDDEFVPYEEVIEMKKWNKNIKISLMPYTSHNFGIRHPYKKNTLSDDIRIVCDETIKFFQEKIT